MGKPAMEDRGEGPEHLVEIVFQLAASEEVDAGVEQGRHGEIMDSVSVLSKSSPTNPPAQEWFAGSKLPQSTRRAGRR